MTNLIHVVGQLKKERERAAKEVERLDTALAALNGTGQSKQTGRRKLSAAGRARIAAAQRARWTKAKSVNDKGKVVTMPKKRTMSAAARKRIAAAQKARWAEVKAAKKG
jgi:hypothetical protein